MKVMSDPDVETTCPRCWLEAPEFNPTTNICNNCNYGKDPITGRRLLDQMVEICDAEEARESKPDVVELPADPASNDTKGPYAILDKFTASNDVRQQWGRDSR